MCCGNFLHKSPEEAITFLGKVAELNRGWDQVQPRGAHQIRDPHIKSSALISYKKTQRLESSCLSFTKELMKSLTDLLLRSTRLMRKLGNPFLYVCHSYNHYVLGVLHTQLKQILMRRKLAMLTIMTLHTITTIGHMDTPVTPNGITTLIFHTKTRGSSQQETTQGS